MRFKFSTKLQVLQNDTVLIHVQTHHTSTLTLSQIQNLKTATLRLQHLTPGLRFRSHVVTAQPSRYLSYPESLGPPFSLNRHGGYIAERSPDRFNLLYLPASLNVCAFLLCKID